MGKAVGKGASSCLPPSAASSLGRGYRARGDAAVLGPHDGQEEEGRMPGWQSRGRGGAFGCVIT